MNVEICKQWYEEPRATKTPDGLQAVLAGERDRFRLEYPCHSPDEQRWYAMDTGGFTFDGDPHLFVRHFDISDRKLAERKAAARTKQLKAIIDVLAHDLRNPVQVIDGYAEMVAEDLDNIEGVDRIRRAAARITEITEATLAFGQTGELSSVKLFALQTLATDAWENLSTEDASLTIEGPTTVHSDRRLLLQLFENLFRNAVEHAGPACVVRVGPVDGGFYVADNGPGIPAAIREKALREDFSTQGTGGLGLPIVQTVVEAHGRDLTITDGTDGGARFEVTGIDVAPNEESSHRGITSTPENSASES